jgi:hypothetical protein
VLVVSELVVLVVRQLAALHPIQRILRMAFAVAEQNVATPAGWK